MEVTQVVIVIVVIVINAWSGTILAIVEDAGGSPW